jgi:hypothetical protein
LKNRKRISIVQRCSSSTAIVSAGTSRTLVAIRRMPSEGRPGGTSPIRVPFDVRRRLHFQHADRMAWAILPRTRKSDRHDLIPEHSSCQILFREFTELNASEPAVVPDTAHRAAQRRHVTIAVPVFPLRSDTSIIVGRADSKVPSTTVSSLGTSLSVPPCCGSRKRHRRP